MLRVACSTSTPRPHVTGCVISILIASSAIAVPAHGQILPLPVGPTDSATIALIEAEGIAYPRATYVPPYPEDFLIGFKAFPERFGPPPVEIGSSERRCVVVPPDGVMELRFDRIWVPTAYMRSGEFRIAAGAAMIYGKGQKLPWTPALPTPGMELLIRARRLSTSDESFHVTITDVIDDRSGKPPQPWDAAFPTRLSFPSPGTWVVVGTSGVNWGCLLFTVG